tara:strand:- start:105 stop:392 length:288 start_codon:yes stop_codon:yes gene_type:complete
MTIAKKTKAKIKMIEMGIVPAFTGIELSKMLNSLSDSDRRAAKRKFRKVWRKILKDRPEMSDMLTPYDGLVPDKFHLRNRSCMVVTSIMCDVDKS